ncbi:hypothetical protein JW968_00815 [Candidatus Woesearchaeota archaeon]|nr:hypothetical protein [Candidatus Woesearchaeota archaeon]
MKKIMIAIFTISLLLVLGCTKPAPLVGGDRDEHGCIGSAGYSWCERLDKCVRIWEEPCTVEDLARTHCNEENVDSLYTCGEYAKVISTLLGGGATYYKLGGSSFQCPVVGPDSMTEECKQMMDAECEEVSCQS